MIKCSLKCLYNKDDLQKNCPAYKTSLSNHFDLQGVVTVRQRGKVSLELKLTKSPIFAKQTSHPYSINMYGQSDIFFIFFFVVVDVIQV